MEEYQDAEGKLTEDGERLLAVAVEANPDPDRFIPILVHAEWWDEGDQLAVYPAYTQRSTEDGSIYLWNGWTEPDVSADVLAQMIAANERAMSDVPDRKTCGLAEMEMFGDTLVMTDNFNTDDDGKPYVDRIGPSDHGLYHLGFGWTWYMLDGSFRDDFHVWLKELNAIVAANPIPVTWVQGARPASGIEGVRNPPYAVHKVNPTGNPMVRRLYEDDTPPEVAATLLSPSLRVSYGIRVVTDTEVAS